MMTPSTSMEKAMISMMTTLYIDGEGEISIMTTLYLDVEGDDLDGASSVAGDPANSLMKIAITTGIVSNRTDHGARNRNPNTGDVSATSAQMNSV